MNYFVRLKNWLLPGACVLCSENTGNLDLCASCTKELPWLGTHCICCAEPLPLVTELDQKCGGCLHYPPAFTKTVALFSYQDPLKKLITGIKFQKKLIYAKLLGELFAERLVEVYRAQPLPEYIIPVPLHPTRLQERGFNQAVELVRPIARKLKLQLDLRRCKRLKSTQPQMELPAAERALNVSNAFEVKAPFPAKYVVVFDDVMTTGSTVNELSKALRKAGVERIDVWCCARTDGVKKC